MVEVRDSSNAIQFSRFQSAVNQLVGGQTVHKDIMDIIKNYLVQHEGYLVAYKDLYNRSFPNDQRFKNKTIVGFLTPSGAVELVEVARNVDPTHKVYLTEKELISFAAFHKARLSNPGAEIRFKTGK